MHRGQPITFMGQPGIWKLRVLELPLSITSVPSGPYDDSFTEEGFLAYATAARILSTGTMSACASCAVLVRR